MECLGGGSGTVVGDRRSQGHSEFANHTTQGVHQEHLEAFRLADLLFVLTIPNTEKLIFQAYLLELEKALSYLCNEVSKIKACRGQAPKAARDLNTQL